jgi:hypothetical protein
MAFSAKTVNLDNLRAAISGQPDFALFFRQPDLGTSVGGIADSAAYPSYCFDDHFANKKSLSSTDLSEEFYLNNARFVRPTDLRAKFQDFRFWRENDPIDLSKPRKKHKSTQRDYRAPWLGLPIQAGNTITAIQLRITNAINQYASAFAINTNADPLWSAGTNTEDWYCEILENNFTLTLVSDDPNLAATWNSTTGSSVLSAPMINSGKFNEVVDITFTTPAPGTPWPIINNAPPDINKVWPNNQDRPRTILVQFKRNLPLAKTFTIAQLSVIPMPEINHYLAFFRVTSAPGGTAPNNFVDYTFSLCGNGVAMPLAIDAPGTQLGTIAKTFYRQFGINLVTLQNPVIQFSNTIPENGNQRDANGSVNAGGPSTFVLRVPTPTLNGITTATDRAGSITFGSTIYQETVISDFAIRFAGFFASPFVNRAPLVIQETTSITDPTVLGGGPIPLPQLSLVFLSDFQTGQFSTNLPGLGSGQILVAGGQLVADPTLGLGSTFSVPNNIMGIFPVVPNLATDQDFTSFLANCRAALTFAADANGQVNYRGKLHQFENDPVNSHHPIDDVFYDGKRSQAIDQNNTAIAGANAAETAKLSVVHTYPHKVTLFDNVTQDKFGANQVGLNQRESIFMHELGHNFGLPHTFDDNTTSKAISDNILRFNFGSNQNPGLNKTRPPAASFNHNYRAPWNFNFESKVSFDGTPRTSNMPPLALTVIRLNPTTVRITLKNNYRRANSTRGTAFTAWVSVYFVGRQPFASARKLYPSTLGEFVGGPNGTNAYSATNPNIRDYDPVTGIWKIDTTLIDGIEVHLDLQSGALLPPGPAATALVGPDLILSELKPWAEISNWNALTSQLNVERSTSQNDSYFSATIPYFDLLANRGYGAFLRVLNAGGRVTLRGNAQISTSTYGAAYGNSNVLYSDPPTKPNANDLFSNDVWGYLLRTICSQFNTPRSKSDEWYTSTFPPTVAMGDSSSGNLMDYDIGSEGGRLGNAIGPMGTRVHDHSYLLKYQWDLLRYCARHYSGTPGW